MSLSLKVHSLLLQIGLSNVVVRCGVRGSILPSHDRRSLFQGAHASRLWNSPTFLSHLTLLGGTGWLMWPRGVFSFLQVNCSYPVAKSPLTLWDPMGCSTLGSSLLHYLPEFAQIHVHWVSDAIYPSYPLPPPSPFAFNLSQPHGLKKSQQIRLWLTSFFRG